jgi:hypothetical protein
LPFQIRLVIVARYTRIERNAIAGRGGLSTKIVPLAVCDHATGIRFVRTQRHAVQ